MNFRGQLRLEQDHSVQVDAQIEVLDVLGLRAASITVLKGGPFGNQSWLVETLGRERFVLRRYHDRATADDLVYEHAVLRHLADLGWMVPHPVGELIRHQEAWYCPTRYVPGGAVSDEPTDQRRRRGADLARLHLALGGLGEHIGQRPGWRAQHTAVTVHTDIDWDECLRAFAQHHSKLASWADAAAVDAREALSAIGADQLPTIVVHGDFHEGNVHYEQHQLAGVIDFGLTHLDSRPYELAIARTYRAPETIDAYRKELARNDWPLSELEEASIEPINHAFRVDMVAWQLDHGRRVGAYDLAMIERQLSKTATAPP